MDINTTIKLNNGVEIPQLALGTAEIEDGGTVNAVKWAIEGCCVALGMCSVAVTTWMIP